MRANRLLAVLAVSAPGAVMAQTWSVPAESVRCLSKWGANDERGSGNHMNAASVMRAVRLSRAAPASASPPPNGWPSRTRC